MVQRQSGVSFWRLWHDFQPPSNFLFQYIPIPLEGWNPRWAGFTQRKNAHFLEKSEGCDVSKIIQSTLPTISALHLCPGLDALMPLTDPNPGLSASSWRHDPVNRSRSRSSRPSVTSRRTAASAGRRVRNS